MAGRCSELVSERVAGGEGARDALPQGNHHGARLQHRCSTNITIDTKQGLLVDALVQASREAAFNAQPSTCPAAPSKACACLVTNINMQTVAQA